MRRYRWFSRHIAPSRIAEGQSRQSILLSDGQGDSTEDVLVALTSAHSLFRITDNIEAGC